jgi:hypothetical protein
MVGRVDYLRPEGERDDGPVHSGGHGFPCYQQLSSRNLP